jgi:leucyl aminopeptidase (aminopeptidase T)
LFLRKAFRRKPALSISMPESLASIAVNKCLHIKSTDVVTILLNEHFIPLAEDFAIECIRNRADVLLNLYTDRYYVGYLSNLSADSLREPSVWCRELTRISTAEFWFGDTYDPTAFRKIPVDKKAADWEGESKAHSVLNHEHKVRSLFVGLGVVSKPRARVYGFSFDAWKRMMQSASGVNPDTFAKKGREIASILQSSEKIRVRAPNGTDMQMSVKGRTPFVNDGIVDEQDIQQGNLGASLPAGSVAVAVIEDSANGKVVLDVPTPGTDRMVRRIVWAFEAGRVTSFEGDRGANALREAWEASSGDRDRIASISIGFNPEAREGYTVNSIVSGAVGIGMGSNERLSGKNKSGFVYSGTISRCTLEADGRAVVEMGKLLI